MQGFPKLPEVSRRLQNTGFARRATGSANVGLAVEDAKAEQASDITRRDGIARVAPIAATSRHTCRVKKPSLNRRPGPAHAAAAPCTSSARMLPSASTRCRSAGHCLGFTSPKHLPCPNVEAKVIAASTDEKCRCARAETGYACEMTLDFPNPSRSYDATERSIRFWGHDGALEVVFFIRRARSQIAPGSSNDKPRR